MKRLAILLALIPAAAAAGDNLVLPEIPDEITKIEALKLAYEINGNSMVGTVMIDLSEPKSPWPKSDKNMVKLIPETKGGKL